MNCLRPTIIALLALAAAVLVLAADDARSQVLRLTLDSPNPQDFAEFGSSLAMGDADGDGRADLLVGARENVDGNVLQGRAYLFSGATGALLLTLDTPNPQADANFGFADFGTPLAMGDADGDGRADPLIGASGEGRAYLFSGATGALLQTLEAPNPQAFANFGLSVAMGDTDGDGRADLLIGASGEGRAYLFSGATGALLQTLEANGAGFGSSLAMGDADGDGRADLLVGAPLEFVVATNSFQGRAYLFSGATGALLLTLDTPNPPIRLPHGQFPKFGISAAMGDTDGDGRADLLVGAIADVCASDQGCAYLFSGATGALLRTLDSPNPEAPAGLGSSLAMGDADGDGRADLLIGAPREQVGPDAAQGRAYLFSGASDALLQTLDTPDPPQSWAQFGRSLAMGDADGDGRADLLVGAPGQYAPGAFQGRAYLFSSAPTPTPGPCPSTPTLATGTITGWPESGFVFLFDDYVGVVSEIEAWWSINRFDPDRGWFYGYNVSTEVARAPGVTDISEIADASVYPYEDWSVGPVDEGDFVLFHNKDTGYYAAFRVDDIYGPDNPSALLDATWYLQEDGSPSFCPATPAPTPTSTPTATPTPTPTPTPTATPTPTPPPQCVDLDDDGRVTGRDVAIVARALFSQPGVKRWQAAADLNSDERVDLIDLFVVISSMQDRDCR